MTGMRCAQLREVAPDVALGLLTGEERAAALAHLERCDRCRVEVTSLAGVADEVLLAGPRATPPEGFDARMLARLAAERAAGGRLAGTPAPSSPSRSVAHHSRRRVVVAALAAAAAVLVVGGAAVMVAREDPAVPTVATAEMRTGSGRIVGDASATGDPAVVTVAVPEWSMLLESWGDAASGTYWLSVELADGARTMAPVPSTRASWTVPVDAPVDDLVAVSVLDDAGRVWCSGRFAT